MSPPEPDQLTASIVHNILIVEDDPDSAHMLKTILEQNGYEVSWAKDGGQAHSSIVMRRPDLVLLDMILPGETGYEVCEHIKVREKKLPIIALTAIDMEDSRDLAKRVGCDGYFTKPYDPQELLNAIPKIAEEVWRRTHIDDAPPAHKISFQCKCGKKMKVKEQHRGKSMTCPDCGEIIQVPRH